MKEEKKRHFFRGVLIKLLKVGEGGWSVVRQGSKGPNLLIKG